MIPLNTPDEVATPTLGRTPDVSDAEVFAAIEQLQREGRRLTPYAIKLAVGNRGNPQRYRALLAEYQAQRPTLTATPAQPLPSELQTLLDASQQGLAQQLAQLANTLYQRACNMIEQRMAQAVHDAQQQTAQVRAELQEADLANAELDDQLTQLTDQHAAAQVQIAQLQTALRDSLAQQQSLADSVTQLQARIEANQAQLDAAHAERQHLCDTQQRLTQQIEALQADKQSAQASAQHWQDKATQYEAERDQHLADKLAAQQDANSHKFKVGQLEQRIADLLHENTRLIGLLKPEKTPRAKHKPEGDTEKK